MGLAVSICFAGSRRGGCAPGAARAAPRNFPGPHSASQHRACGSELRPSAPVLYCKLFCASVSKMRPEIPGQPKRVYKAVMLSIKLDLIKHIWDNLAGYSLGLGTLKNILYK